MKKLIAALQFLTALPLPDVKVNEKDFAGSMRWFPVAGLVVGGVVTGAAWMGMRVDPWLGALLALVAWVMITGALHLDGLGDIADAAGAAHHNSSSDSSSDSNSDRDRLDAVLADPHIGSFGVVAIGLQLVTKLILLQLALETVPLWTLAIIPALARAGPLVWTLLLPPLHEGLGTRFRSGVNWYQGIFWIIGAMIAAWFAPPLGTVFALFVLWAYWVRYKIGGISGDGHGAGIELVESGLLLAMLCLS